MRKMKQTLNTQLRKDSRAGSSTPNAQFRRDSRLDVERWTLDVGRFRPGLR